MKEKLYTIPLNDAVNANDECPFCFIERSVEQDLIDFVLGSGSSYMEADIREMTDNAGFCRRHFKAMFDYGNTLGNAWILKTHTQKMIGEMEKAFSGFKPTNAKFMERLKKATIENPIADWINEKEDSCYICKHFEDTYQRYMDTFFYLYENDSEFKNKVCNGKGFCLPHFADLCHAADLSLKGDKLNEFYECFLLLMVDNMKRINEDVSWMVDKFDYRNQDADWKNSKDSIQRAMQKLKGGYPADPIYKSKK